MARDLKYKEILELLLTLMLVKQQQLSVFFFYTGKSHKIGEVHDGAATMDWMAQEQERDYNYICSYNVLGIFNETR
jgi:elongation factor G